MTADQIAREIAAEWWAKGISTGSAASDSERRKDIAVCAERILRRHWPASSVVEEEQLNAYQDAAFTLGRIDAERGVFASTTKEWKDQHEELKKMHAQLLAASPANTPTHPQPVLIRRPTREVSAVVVPEDGWYAKRFDNGLKNFSASNTFYKAGEAMVGSVAAIRRTDTDAPTTWIERTTATTAPRDWQASDFPEGRIVLLCGTQNWSYTAGYSRDWIADSANGNVATHAWWLPEVTP